MIVTSIVQTFVKERIAGSDGFEGVTPQLATVVDAITAEVIAAVQQELTGMKTTFNLHVHGSAAGPTSPPAPPMA
jgi:hypothetical protein